MDIIRKMLAMNDSLVNIYLRGFQYEVCGGQIVGGGVGRMAVPHVFEWIASCIGYDKVRSLSNRTHYANTDMGRSFSTSISLWCET